MLCSYYYRISPDDDDDEDLKEFEELQKKQQNREKLSIIEKGKLFVEELVQKVGFFGILACASVRYFLQAFQHSFNP